MKIKKGKEIVIMIIPVPFENKIPNIIKIRKLKLFFELKNELESNDISVNKIVYNWRKHAIYMSFHNVILYRAIKGKKA